MQSFLKQGYFTYLPPDVDIGIENCVRIGTLGDGSCFFHSVCMALDKNGLWDNISYNASATESEKNKIIKLFRNKLSDLVTQKDLDKVFEHITNNIRVPALDDFKKKLETVSTWADEPMIRWTSHCLKINIIFLNLKQTKVFCDVHHPDIVKSMYCKTGTCGGPNTTIVVAWVLHKHFELIGQLMGPRKNGAEIRCLFEGPQVKSLMTAYFESCSSKTKQI